MQTHLMILRLAYLWLVAMRRERMANTVAVLVLNGLMMLRGVVRSRRVDRARWFKRIMACRRCPILHKRSWRCRNGEDGCGCLMPLKARFENQGCWARENGVVGAGWPDNVK